MEDEPQVLIISETITPFISLAVESFKRSGVQAHICSDLSTISIVHSISESSHLVPPDAVIKFKGLGGSYVEPSLVWYCELPPCALALDPHDKAYYEREAQALLVAIAASIKCPQINPPLSLQRSFTRFDRHLFRIEAQRLGLNVKLTNLHVPNDLALDTIQGIEEDTYLVHRCGSGFLWLALERETSSRLFAREKLPTQAVEVLQTLYAGFDDWYSAILLEVKNGEVFVRNMLTTPDEATCLGFEAELFALIATQLKQGIKRRFSNKSDEVYHVQ